MVTSSPFERCQPNWGNPRDPVLAFPRLGGSPLPAHTVPRRLMITWRARRHCGSSTSPSSAAGDQLGLVGIPQRCAERLARARLRETWTAELIAKPAAPPPAPCG